jgi:hypothetical protein
MGTVEDEQFLRQHGRDGRPTFGTMLTVQVLPRFQVLAHVVELSQVRQGTAVGADFV